MGVRLFDRKFGADRLREVPRAPGVYLFRDATGRVLYAGKARDLRRRLAGYRNASRRKVHRKMRTLVRLAVSLEVRPQESETQALLLENQIIRSLRPPYNVDGAYHFLYPALGVGRHEGRVLLAFTSTPEEWGRLDLRWHGCFRSRMRARAAFDALVALFARLGHPEPRSRLPDVRLRRGTRLEAFRRVPPELAAATDAFLCGESTDLLSLLFERLLESSRARRQAAEVDVELRTLGEFARKDVAPLRRALRTLGRSGWVPGDERDALFIAARQRRLARSTVRSGLPVPDGEIGRFVSIRLPIKAVPSSSRDCVAGWLGDVLKVRVTAPAEDGKANRAIEAVVTEALGLPRGSTRVVAGRSSSRKILEITGLSEAEVHRRLGRGLD